ncbi:MAG: kinase [Oceanococcus sp.]
MTTPDETLLEWLIEQAQRKSGVFFLGICGSQSSGKSTLAQHLQRSLGDQGFSTAILSLDDLYLSHQGRQQLARDVHPLLATRGVPGTHDVAQGLTLFDAIDNLSTQVSVPLPRFDKATDDPAPKPLWPLVPENLDVLIFEGWCVGVPAQSEAALETPINALEQEHDPNGGWRQWVNRQLSDNYPQLFKRLDKLIYLQIPNWDAVLRWRGQQEQQTAASAEKNARGIMSTEQIAQFIQHYERLTRHALDCLPQTADVVRQLGAEHQVLNQLIRETAG